MDAGEQITGTRDEHYNLVSVLYHALHGAETIETYVLDAEAAGDERLAAFFREAQATQMGIAERAKELLGIEERATPETAGGAMTGTVAPETDVPPDTGPVDVRGRAAPEVGLPPEGATSPDPAPGDVPPGSAGAQREPGMRTGRGDVPAEETPPIIEVPTPPGTVPLPDEDLMAETQATIPDEAQTGAPRASEAPQMEETPGEPGRATQERREPEEEKGLIDKVKDAFTGREESDRQRDR